MIDEEVKTEAEGHWSGCLKNVIDEEEAETEAKETVNLFRCSFIPFTFSDSGIAYSFWYFLLIFFFITSSAFQSF